MSLPLSAAAIQAAKQAFPTELIKESPFLRNDRLSDKYEANIYFKREDQQSVRSYKIRGAHNVMRSLSDAEKKAGVVAASAGNHAQGVAVNCAYFQVQGKIFMPITTPAQKVRATQKFGGKFVEVILTGDTFDQAYQASKAYAETHGATFVHPFDDWRTIIGQGTIGVEIMAQCPQPIDYLLLPVGGGGVSSGVGAYFAEKSPHTQVIGVEPAEAPSMKTALAAQKNTGITGMSTFVDGAAVQRVGDNTFACAQQFLSDMLTVPENRLCTTMLELLNDDGIVCEPAGALSVDALKDLAPKLKGKTVVCLISGGNMDFERLPEIKERSTKFEGLKKYYTVLFPQRPGALREFLEAMGVDDDIARFEYLKKTNKDAGPALIGIESSSAENFVALEQNMTDKGIRFRDVTHDEVIFGLLV